MRRPRTMPNAPGDGDGLALPELDHAVLEVDEQGAVEHHEELILILVLVPVILALQHAQPNDRIVDLAERLVVPLVLTRVDQRLDVEPLAGRVLDVGGGGVFRNMHRNYTIWVRLEPRALPARRRCGRHAAAAASALDW